MPKRFMVLNTIAAVANIKYAESVIVTGGGKDVAITSWLQWNASYRSIFVRNQTDLFGPVKNEI